MKLLIILAMIMSNVALAKTSQICNESVTIELAKHLTKKDPEAKLSIVVNQENQVIGLTDLSGFNPDVNLNSVEEISPNIQLNSYGFNNVTYNLKYVVLAPNGLISCKILSLNKVIED